MFKVNDQEFNDMEVAQTYWDRLKKRMDWCRNEASEYLKNNDRRKFYKLSYHVAGQDKVTYAAIGDDDRKKIEAGFEKVIAEEGPFENSEQRADALTLFIDDLDILWENYLPEFDLNWADEDPVITNIDFDDFFHCCKFKVMHTNWFSDDPEKLDYEFSNIEISDDEFVELVAAKLFDEHLTFYDLKYLFEDTYNRIEGYCHTPHQHQLIFMTEINDVAKSILESKNKEELPPTIGGNPMMVIIWDTILKESEKFDDPKLFKAFRLAISESIH